VDDRRIVARSVAGARNFSIQWVSQVVAVGRGGREVNSYIQSSAEINKWSCTSTGHCPGEVHRDIFAVSMCMLDRRRTLPLYSNVDHE
jgi:hypothetical protein